MFEGATGAVFYTIFALLLTSTILIHEFGHSYAARRNGLPTNYIKLWMFGGAANIPNQGEHPRTEAEVGSGGPLATLLTIPLLVAGVGGGIFLNSGFVVTLFHGLAAINIILLVLNLIPVFPLDGGRVLRGIMTMYFGERTGSYFVSIIGIATAFLIVLTGFNVGSLLLIGLGVFFMLTSQSQRPQYHPDSESSPPNQQSDLQTDNGSNPSLSVGDHPDDRFHVNLSDKTFALSAHLDEQTISTLTRTITQAGGAVTGETATADYVIVHPDEETDHWTEMIQDTDNRIVTPQEVLE